MQTEVISVEVAASMSEASKKAMRLYRKCGLVDYVLADAVELELDLPMRESSGGCEGGGDRRRQASLRVTRDRLMVSYDEIYPGSVLRNTRAM